MTDQANSTTRQQLEAVRFGSAVSEAVMSQVQGNLNYLLGAVLPIGSVIYSMLDESQFQDLTSAGWVLADGRSCVGSDYALLTGNTTVPDGRGVVPRGKNHARSGSTGNSAGDLALGTYQADQMIAHVHSTHYRIPTTGPGGSDGGGDHNRGLQDITEDSGSAGAGTETRPRSLTLNAFFRIN